MKPVVIILLFALFAGSCYKMTVTYGTPECMEQKIATFSKQAVCSNATVKLYRFQNEAVYVFDPGSCGADLLSEVANNRCQSIGFLGGIAGNTQINGVEFSTAVYIKTIWQK